jgi:hypothetical protein
VGYGYVGALGGALISRAFAADFDIKTSDKDDKSVV